MKKYTFLGLDPNNQNSEIYPVSYLLAQLLNKNMIIRSGESSILEKEIKQGSESEGEFIIPFHNFNHSESGYIISNQNEEMIKKAKNILIKSNALPFINEIKKEYTMKYIILVFQLLGMNLDSSEKSSFFLYYDENENLFNTMTVACKIADYFNIPKRNIFNNIELNKIKNKLNNNNFIYNDVKNYLIERMKNPKEKRYNPKKENSYEIMKKFKEYRQ